MKNILLFLYGFTVILLGASFNQQDQQKKPKFEKIVFVELTMEEDSMLFLPYSKAWEEKWQWRADVFLNKGTELMNREKYRTAFKERTDNLWTILHPMMIKGTIQVYSPYDPETYGMGAWDHGELRFPLIDNQLNENFLCSDDVRNDMCMILGSLGPQSDIPMTDDYGDYIINTYPDGSQGYVYPPRDYYWFDDKAVVKYKLRVRIELNKNGKEKKRVIESIAPIRYRTNEGEETTEEQEMLWFDFAELKPILKEAYFLDKDWQPTTYLDHISDKVKNADIRKENN